MCDNTRPDAKPFPEVCENNVNFSANLFNQNFSKKNFSKREARKLVRKGLGIKNLLLHLTYI